MAASCGSTAPGRPLMIARHMDLIVAKWLPVLQPLEQCPKAQGGHSSSHTFSYQGGQNLSQKLPVNVPLHLAGQTWLLGGAAPAAREPGRAACYHRQAPRHRVETWTPLSAALTSHSPAPRLSALLPPTPPCSALGSLVFPVLTPLNKQSDILKSKPFHDSRLL